MRSWALLSFLLPVCMLGLPGGHTVQRCHTEGGQSLRQAWLPVQDHETPLGGILLHRHALTGKAEEAC